MACAGRSFSWTCTRPRIESSGWRTGAPIGLSLAEALLDHPDLSDKILAASLQCPVARPVPHDRLDELLDIATQGGSSSRCRALRMYLPNLSSARCGRRATLDSHRRIVTEPDYAKLFVGLNVAGVILTFLAALSAIAATTRLSVKIPCLLAIVLVVYVVGQMVIVIATVDATRIRFTPANVLALVSLYTLLSFWDLFALAIGLPFIAITLVLGPLTTVVFVLATVILGMYLIEHIIGYDLRGAISALETPVQTLVVAVVWVISLLVLIWHYGRHESGDWAIEKAANWVYDLRQQLQGQVEEIIRQYSRD
jgi:hypothetical protein